MTTIQTVILPLKEDNLSIACIYNFFGFMTCIFLKCPDVSVP